MNHSENSKLIEGLIKGDERAYVFLMDTYQRRLYAYALTCIDDPALAQDIVQNVFLKTWKFRKKLKNSFSIERFLFRSVHNEFVNTYNKNKAVMTLQMKYYESLEEVAESTNENALQKMIELISKEIERLPPRCREVFILSKKEGLTNKEISEHLSISTNTVEVQISKAFKALRKKLEHKREWFLFLVFGFDSKTFSKYD